MVAGSGSLDPQRRNTRVAPGGSLRQLRFISTGAADSENVTVPDLLGGVWLMIISRRSPRSGCWSAVSSVVMVRATGAALTRARNGSHRTGPTARAHKPDSWCRDRELNPDELALTAPSKQRV